MTQPVSLFDVVPTQTSAATVEVFDPPMCCPTGLCGPTLDQTLLDVSEMVLTLQRENLRVERYQMTSNPNAFLANAEVMKLVREKQKVLFLCTGNSCRSQMAEAIVNARLGDEWEAVSAGTKPAGYVHPKALAALAEIGIQHTGRSKLVDEFRGADFDLVVTVCDSAAEECPVWLGKGKRFHHSFPDPAKTDNMDDFRKVRDDIEREIPRLLQQVG